MGRTEAAVEPRQARVFADVLPAFDGYTVTFEDARSTYDETRYITIGLLKGRAVLIAHTERKEAIRIIPVRKATKYEEISYLQEITNKLGAARRTRRRGY